MFDVSVDELRTHSTEWLDVTLDQYGLPCRNPLVRERPADERLSLLDDTEGTS